MVIQWAVQMVLRWDEQKAAQKAVLMDCHLVALKAYLLAVPLVRL
jgi:hypothetical protein